MKIILKMLLGLTLIAFVLQPTNMMFYNDDWLLLTEDVRYFQWNSSSELAELWKSFRHSRKYSLVLSRPKSSLNHHSSKEKSATDLLSFEAVGSQVLNSQNQNLKPSELKLISSSNSFSEWNELVMEYAPVGTIIRGEPMFSEQAKGDCAFKVSRISQTQESHALSVDIEINSRTYKLFPQDQTHLRGLSTDQEFFMEMTIKPPFHIQSFYVGSTQKSDSQFSCLVVNEQDSANSELPVASTH